MNNDYFNIISIDPGKNLGIAILSIDANTFNIIDIKTETYYLDKLANDGVDRTINRLVILQNIISNLYLTYLPIVVCYETPFINSKFPMAVVQLTQYTTVIEMTLKNLNPYIRIFKFPPRYIKMAIGAGGDADKDGMYNTVSKVSELVNYIHPSMTEHVIDAVAIGYTILSDIREFPHILYALY